jgi:hypothetical protein
LEKKPLLRQKKLRALEVKIRDLKIVEIIEKKARKA